MAEATPQEHKLNVFISYSRDDLGFADQLDAALGVTGFAPTLDRHGVSGGEAWKIRLGNLILRCRHGYFRAVAVIFPFPDLRLGGRGGDPA